jgi:hypothetical protein
MTPALSILPLLANAGVTAPVLEPARWPGGPLICSVENLPAHESESAMKKFHEANGPSCQVIRSGKCKHCGYWHMETRAPDPSGGSSGTGRGKK